jgi:hypothetical protein
MFNGCATLFGGSTDRIDISSLPSGANVHVNGQYIGTTPLQLKLRSKDTYSIDFHKEGYENKIVLVDNSVAAGWIILDILGGVWPVFVDAATGDWYSLDQDRVTAVLKVQQGK